LYKIGHVLRLIRQGTLQEIANSTGLSKSFLSELEHNKKSISIDNLHKLCSYHNIPMSLFFKWVESIEERR
jgi:transcriptional regulator with XRE-family HTH domain